MRKATFNNVLAVALIGFVMLSVGYLAVKVIGDNESDAVPAPGQDQGIAGTSDRVVVYYFHGSVRCVSCTKIEAYTKESLDTAFADALKDGSMEWRTVNVEEPENRHFIKDYDLYIKTVVISDVHGGNQTEYRKLDEVWNLLDDKDRFMAYIQDNVRPYLEGQ